MFPYLFYLILSTKKNRETFLNGSLQNKHKIKICITSIKNHFTMVVDLNLISINNHNKLGERRFTTMFIFP